MGITIKTKWDLQTFIYAITKNGVKPCMPFEIIIRETLFGKYKIFYKVRDISGGRNGEIYEVEEKYTALNPDCLEGMIINGEVDNADLS